MQADLLNPVVTTDYNHKLPDWRSNSGLRSLTKSGVLDLYSRRIVGWTLPGSLVIDALH